MAGRLLDIDPFSGTVETVETDEETGNFAIRRVGDVQPIIDRNRELANHSDGWLSPAHEMRHAASIPIEVVYKWLQDYGIRAWRKEDWPAVRKLLNSNEWRYLRVSEFMI